MPGFGFVLDPTSEDPGNAQIDLNDGTSFRVLTDPEPDLSPPDIETQWATSGDTEGSRPAASKHNNRRITLPVRVYGGTPAGLDALIAKLQQKAGKILRESGTLKVTVPSGKVVIFDLYEAQAPIAIRRRIANLSVADTLLTFAGAPYGRGQKLVEVVGATNLNPAPNFENENVGVVPSGWAAYNWGALAATYNAISTDGASSGTKSHRISRPAGSGAGAVDSGLFRTMAVKAGRYYTYVVMATATQPGCSIKFYLGALGYLTIPCPVNAFTEIRRTFGPYPVDGAVEAHLYEALIPDGTQGNVYFDEGMIVETTDPAGYTGPRFDGDTAGCRWTGAPGVSTSERIEWATAGVQVTRSETTLPALAFTVANIPGDVPALGKLEVTDAQGADQWWLLYGLQSQSFDAAATAGLLYQAEALTAQGGAGQVADANASGGQTIAHTALASVWQSMLSTKLNGGSHLSHVGEYLVIARVRGSVANSDDVQLRLEWSHGDLRAPTRNDPVTIAPGSSQLALANLGTISIPKVPRGTQQWEGRVLARADNPGDDAHVDYLLLVPLEACGQASAVAPTATPTSLTARDEFTQTAGALTGKTAAAGGNWAGGGDADDFTVNATADTADRTAVSDVAAAARRVWLPVAAMTDTVAQVDFMTATLPSGAIWVPGLLLRHDAASGRHLRVSAQSNGNVFYDFYTGDALTTAGSKTAQIPALAAGTWYSLRALADARGRLFVWFGLRGTELNLVLAQYAPGLDAGGQWASGVPGFFDLKLDASAQTRSYDNFWAASPPRDAAMFASQSAELRYDGALREDAAGAIWTPVSSFEGDYVRIPPAGMEGRAARLVVKASRNPPGVMPDPAIDDIAAQLTVIPRYLELPE